MKSISPRFSPSEISRRTVLRNAILGALPATFLATQFGSAWGANEPSGKQGNEEMVEAANRDFTVRLYGQ